MSWLKRKDPIVIYTDGSCICPHGAGGWAAVILKGSQKQEIAGYQHQTTNNRMELTAAIKALQILETGSDVLVFTDSQYLQKGIVSWAPIWAATEWMTAAKKEVMNRDLWEELLELSKLHIISWNWVKAHRGDLHNERCDVLASQQAKYCNQLQKEFADVKYSKNAGTITTETSTAFSSYSTQESTII